MSISVASEQIAQRSGKVWWKELWVQVMIAMALGIALGIYRPELAIQMQPFGDAFIKAIRMLIAPIIFCTVVNGIAHMADMARVGRVAIKSIIYFEAITSVALVIGLVAVNLWQPGAGMNVDATAINAGIVEPYVKQTAVLGFIPFLLNIIPSTFVGAFAEGNILQVLFLSVVCGFALIWLGERAKPLTDVIDVGCQDGFWRGPDRDVGGAARRLRRDRLHHRKIRPGLAGLARQAGRRLLRDLPVLRRWLCSVRSPHSAAPACSS